MHKLKVLKTKKGRDALQLFVVEGEKSVNEIPADWEICSYVFAERYAKIHDTTRYRHRAACEIIRDTVFDAAADTVTPQGIAAICRQRSYALGDVLRTDHFLLMGEHLSDPGNIGALIRTAAAAGADGVILTKDSGEIYNPKVLRAAAGAVLRIPVVTGVDLHTAARQIKQAGGALLAAHLRGTVLPYGLDLRHSCCFMVGNEAHGLSDEAVSLADRLVRLPMPGGTESLNASVAGSILLYEAVRQRQR